MIPANRRKIEKNALQQRRRRRGAEWENDLLEELNQMPQGWACGLPKNWAGQPYDISAMIQGQGLAIECKRIERGKLGYSAFTQNEREHLTRYEDAGGMALVAIYRDSDQRRAFVPWYSVRNDILGGIRGSIDPMAYPEDLAEVWEVMHP